jgi:hypothetical protein
VPISRSTSRHVAFVVLAGASLGAAALGSPQYRSLPVSSARAPLPDTLVLDVDYAGLGAEGVDLVWRGTAAGLVPGIVTIRMEYAGPAGDHGMPVWPVNAWLFYSADEYDRSFAVELTGSMRWPSGEMRVAGLVSDGERIGVPVEVSLRLKRPGMAGSASVVFLPRLALLETLALGI